MIETMQILIIVCLFMSCLSSCVEYYPGELGQPCRPGNDCNPGLKCVDGKCVPIECENPCAAGEKRNRPSQHTYFYQPKYWMMADNR
jgi:hypothetical protein